MHTILCITSYAFSSVVVSIHFGHYSSLVAHNMVSLLQTSNWQRWIHHAPVCTSEGPACHWRASWKPTACAVCNKSNITSTACLQQASVYFTAGTWTLLFCYILSYYAFSSVQTIHFAHYLLLLDDGMQSLIHSYSWPQRLHSALLRISRRTTLQVKSKWTPIICASALQVMHHYEKLCSSTDVRPSKIKRPFGSMNPSLHIQKFRDQDH